jgi:phosphate-selective porin OprO/OprP
VGFSGSTAFNFNKSNFQPGGSPEGIRLSDQPELRIDFNPLIDTGFIPAKSAVTWGFELAANWRNFLVQGEYIGIEVNPTVGKELNFAGGESRPYLASSATYGSPVPYRPFEIGRGWGAWELAGRYSVTDLNSGVVFGGRQTIVSAALSWYATEHVRFTLQGSHVDVDRRNPIGSIQVGQSFWDVALRTQVVY